MEIKSKVMKKILVPCDFSKPAVNAYRLALDIASRAKGEVHLVNVIELPVLHDTVLMPVLNFESVLLDEFIRKTERQFIRLKSRYRKEEVKVVTKVEYGSPSRALLEYAAEIGIDLIVMGSHGATGIKEVFIGSNAEKMVRRSQVPVLVVKDYVERKITNIIFPNTLETEHQEDLVSKVKELQNFFGALLHIVYINTPLNFTSDIITYQRLKAFASRYMLKNFTLNVFNHQDEEEGIMNFADKVQGDLIALGTHGRTGISHMINGSLAENIVNHADKLIWTYSLRNEPVEA